MSDQIKREKTGTHRLDRLHDGPGTARAEQRTTARYEVSLPVRFTVDGATFHEGVVTSISGGGVFIQAELLPSMKASVWFDVGLGAELGRLRCAGTVVNLNRRYGTELIYGFGVRLSNPPADLASRIETLRATFPGPVRLDGLGFLVWPLYGGSDRTMDATGSIGLQVWSGARWLDGGPATHVVQPGTRGPVTGRPIESYVRALRAIAPQIQSVREELVAFGYYGKALAPQDGLPRAEVVASLGGKTAEVTPWVRSLALQMRIIDDLGSAAWRLENVWGDPLRSLEEDQVVLSKLRAEMDQLSRTHPAGDAASSEAQAARGLEALDRYLGRVSWAAHGFVPPDETPRVFATWKQERRTGTLKAKLAWGADPALVTTPGQEMVAVPRRQLLIATGLMALIVATAGVLFVRLQTVPSANPTEPPAVLAKEELGRFMPLETVVVLGRKVVCVVPEDWVELPDSEKIRNVSAVAQVLSDKAFREAEIKQRDGKVLATWKGGRVTLEP